MHTLSTEIDMFEIGLCAYTAKIDYTPALDGELEIVSCEIEVSASENEMWVPVPSKYFDHIATALYAELEEQRKYVADHCKPLRRAS